MGRFIEYYFANLRTAVNQKSEEPIGNYLFNYIQIKMMHQMQKCNFANWLASMKFYGMDQNAVGMTKFWLRAYQTGGNLSTTTEGFEKWGCSSFPFGCLFLLPLDNMLSPGPLISKKKLAV